MRITATLIVALACPLSLLAAESLRSGLQPGERLDATFEPLNVTGPHAGEPHCLVCENGPSPVVMVFARSVNPLLIRLLAGIDAATAKNTSAEMGSFAVFLSEQADLATQLEQLGSQHPLKHLVLSIDKPEGPEGFAIANDAELTVVLYTKYVVKANHAFRQGELTQPGIDRILSDLTKILPQKPE